MLPVSERRLLKFESGEAIGISNRWQKGQYCAVLTEAGIVGCGIYDLPIAAEFDLAVAICRGTPAKPLVVPEDLFESKIVDATPKARSYGIEGKFTAFLVPEAPPGNRAGAIQLNDVYVDEKGWIYTNDRDTGGLYILEYTGPTPLR